MTNEFRITLVRHKDKVRLVLWAEGEKAGDAVKKAFKENELAVTAFIRGNCLYDIAVINKKSLDKAKLLTIQRGQRN